MKPSITILLSTYNGADYIKEQLDSLFSQDYSNFKILVRDDGSKDDTIKILNYYKKKENKEFSYYIGSNLGSCKSFLSLLNDAPKSDYYAFCDQDDVWDNDKLSCAVEKLFKLDNKKPNLYFSNLRVVDKNLKFVRLSHNSKQYMKNKFSPLIEPLTGGCTMVFNDVARELIINNIPDKCSMHDSWIYLVCGIFGSIVYDEKPHMSYRIHEKNVVGTYKKKNISSYIKRFVELISDSSNPRYINAISFKKCYEYMLEKDVYDKVNEICQYKNSLIQTIKLLIDRDLKASTLSREIKNKIFIILRRF